MSQTQSDDGYHTRVAIDHYAHQVLSFAAAAYGWYLHGFWIGLGVYVALHVVISASNVSVMAWSADRNLANPFLPVRISRWFWLAAAWALLFASV